MAEDQDTKAFLKRRSNDEKSVRSVYRSDRVCMAARSDSRSNDDNSGRSVYLVQFGTGASINLLPLAAGQLYSRFKEDSYLCERLKLEEIIFRRPRDSAAFASRLNHVFAIGFSCFTWNMRVSLQAARSVREYFPGALIVLGGPSVPGDLEGSTAFLDEHPFVDVISISEGEDIFVSLCRHQLEGRDFSGLPAVIYRDRRNGEISYPSKIESLPNISVLPSPYLDGTFTEMYKKYPSEFSGIIWETNRGCPFKCAYCTWGNLPFHTVRKKPLEILRREVEWIGRNKIRYVAMSDANFGICRRDLELTQLLAENKEKYGYPRFLSVSWVKNSSTMVTRMAGILKKSGIGFRITHSLQSHNPDVLKAVHRSNINKETFEEIKKVYHREYLYSYTELILGLPLETGETFLSGIEESLSCNVYDQLYVYPCLLFPNTLLASQSFRKQYGIKSRLVCNRYTKNKEIEGNEERVEVVIGTDAMPQDAWRESFVTGFFILAVHDDRLAFFILQYLKRELSVSITALITFAWQKSLMGGFPATRGAFSLLNDTACKVQEEGKSFLIEPGGFDNIPFDPPEGIFLELLVKRGLFYKEFLRIVKDYLEKESITVEDELLEDLFAFQEAVMAHPDGPGNKRLLLHYNWIDYFGFSFNLPGKELLPSEHLFTVVDPAPCNGDPARYLENHFDVRGVPPFNMIYNETGDIVFPMHSLKE